MKVQIILGSTREGRHGEKVARYILGLARERKDFEVELVDLKDWKLPFLESSVSPKMKKYEDPIIKKWSSHISRADAYIIVTPEYNHGYPAVLKNALDHLYQEWNFKPVAFVGYGAGAGGVRAVEQLRLVAMELQMLPTRNEVNVPLVWQAFDENGRPNNPGLEDNAKLMFDQLVSWYHGSKVIQQKIKEGQHA